MMGNDKRHLYEPLFLVSCIFFIYDDIPQPYSDWLWWNPLVHIVVQMRYAFYPSCSGYYISYVYVFAVSLVVFALGIFLLNLFHRDLQK